MSGLGSRYWPEVIEVLRAIVPVYDRVNRVISLGKDEEYRKHAIEGRVMPGNVVLDAGSGYGNMSRAALAEAGGNAQIVMYDPIREMLANVRSYFGQAHPTLSSGIFEDMPFRDNTFDAVMCGYSLRDAIDLKKAISEMHRVLKPGGPADNRRFGQARQCLQEVDGRHVPKALSRHLCVFRGRESGIKVQDAVRHLCPVASQFRSRGNA